MNERGIPGDASWERGRGRQMPEMGSGGGNASDIQPKEIRAKDIGEESLPEGRVLRGVETTGTTLEQRHPDWPHITVKFYLSSHDSSADVPGVSDALRGADVYFYEMTRGESQISYFQSIAEGYFFGEPSLDHVLEKSQLGNKPLEDTIYGPIVRALHEHQTPVVGHMDLHESESDLIERLNNLEERSSYLDTDFMTTLSNLDQNIHAYAVAQAEREEIITQRFEQEMESIVENPKLQGETTLTVVASMGAAHDSLIDLFESNGITTETLVEGTRNIHHHLKAYQEVRQGNSVSTDLLAKAYLHKELIEELKFEKVYAAKVSYLYPIIEQLTLEEIEGYHQNPSIDYLNSVLSRRGLGPFPQTRDELLAAVDK